MGEVVSSYVTIQEGFIRLIFIKNYFMCSKFLISIQQSNYMYIHNHDAAIQICNNYYKYFKQVFKVLKS